MSDRVAVFNQGAIEQLADVQALYETPANRFVAVFVGDSTVLGGTLQGSGACCALQLPDGPRLPGGNVNHPAPPGPRAEPCIRPERIALRTAATPQGPALDATVARVIYHGDHLRLLCAIPPGQALATVKLPLTGAGAHPQAGDAVQLQFPPEAMRIYASAASPPRCPPPPAPPPPPGRNPPPKKQNPLPPPPPPSPPARPHSPSRKETAP